MEQKSKELKCRDFINIFIRKEIDIELLSKYLTETWSDYGRLETEDSAYYEEIVMFINKYKKKEYSWLEADILLRLLVELKCSL